MGFGQAIQDFWKNYVKFDGRAPRIQMWWLVLFSVIVFIVSATLDSVLGMTFTIPGPEGVPMSMGYGPIYCLAALAMLLPSLALTFRRMHDRDKSAWWLLLALIPLVGGIILFIWLYCLRGTVGDNRFGPDPLGGKV